MTLSPRSPSARAPRTGYRHASGGGGEGGGRRAVEALPGFCRFLAKFEPLRQLTGGLRSIPYYDAQADAGLARVWVMTAVDLAAAAPFGFGMTAWYDR